MALAIFRGKSPVLAFRSHLGLTLRELSERTGIAASYLSEIERGHKPGSASALARIAGALGTKIDTLLSEQRQRYAQTQDVTSPGIHVSIRSYRDPKCEQGKENHIMEHPLDSEAVAGWLAADAEAATGAKAVRSARAEAATKIAAATDAEVAFNESIGEAKTAHATARALDDTVKAKIDAGESTNIDDLIKREAVEEAARGAAFDVVTKSEVVADFFAAAAEAARSRAYAEVAYSRAVSSSEIFLDDIVPENLR